jgi:hypothetical protein
MRVEDKGNYWEVDGGNFSISKKGKIGFSSKWLSNSYRDFVQNLPFLFYLRDSLIQDIDVNLHATNKINETCTKINLINDMINDYLLCEENILNHNQHEMIRNASNLLWHAEESIKSTHP